MSVSLILGGARSGKSRRALERAEAAGGTPVMIATAEALDEEMGERIRRHREERGARWRTIEAPLELVDALDATFDGARGSSVVVDCLTLWLSNLMHHGRDLDVERAALVAALARVDGELILVSNELGFGLVPETALGRAFRDEQGRLNQAIAAMADRVELVVAGLPLTLR